LSIPKDFNLHLTAATQRNCMMPDRDWCVCLGGRYSSELRQAIAERLVISTFIAIFQQRQE
jgi:hypothetical protein